jgi:hypothetical protein
MQIRISSWILTLSLLLLISPLQAKTHRHAKHAKRPSPEHQLRILSKRIDRETQGLEQTSHVERLAGQFHTPLSVIEEMRQKGEGWGNITVQLAMAKVLNEKDPVHYATTSDALFQIQQIRANSKSWRSTAKAAGFPLHPVLIQTARSFSSLRNSGITERASL